MAVCNGCQGCAQVADRWYADSEVADLLMGEQQIALNMKGDAGNLEASLVYFLGR